ncbi:MAG: hypothetical protein R6U68_14080 [Desulfobacteraceae bacterium]
MEYKEPAAIAVKHTNPCGAATADNILTAYKKAYEADSLEHNIKNGICIFKTKSNPGRYYKTKSRCHCQCRQQQSFRGRRRRRCHSQGSRA